MKLATQHCVTSGTNTPPLTTETVQALQLELSSRWQVVDNHHLVAEYRFSDFRTGLNFVNQVGALADTEDHHPDVRLTWGRVVLTLWTHQVNALTRNDFILAAKIDQLPLE
jgi:4a-hydroxytetrahydrobiopterin dehydratase